ncbi:MAG TPA: hypothetical protein VF701_14675 [Thermoanaerobaculia bacterium]
MTHGDKAKAKAGKGSQTSGAKSGTKSSRGSQAESKTSKSVKAVKATQTGGKKSSGAQKVAAKAGAAKGASTSGATKAGSGNGSGFANPLVAAAYKRALKAYPGAFRKLTE